jgi:RND family efflux transporter MFP subunit
MRTSSISIKTILLAALLLTCLTTGLPWAVHAAEKTSTPSGAPPARDPVPSEQGASEAREEEEPELSAVIAPWRSAELSADVRGIIESFDFKEGDFLEKDRVVVVISSRRYDLALQRAANAVKASEVDLKRTRQDVLLKEQLLSHKAATTGDVIKAKAEEEVARFRLEEAQTALELSRIDLDSCKVKAPFDGYMALRFKEPFESVDYLQKLFVIVDTSKVYAIASAPESSVSGLTKGARAAFIAPMGKGRRFIGNVERTAKLLDPKSGSRKVYVLIDNPDGHLEIGMTGSLELAK